MLRQKFTKYGDLLLVVTLLASMLWYPGSMLAAPLRAISSYQATNDATNVYYQLNYTTTYSFYRVYIDPDQSTGTGFQIGGIGASYLVENGTLYPYTGNGTSWSWGTGTAVGYTNSAGVANWTIARSTIGETANPNWADLIFQVEAPITSSAKYTHVYSGSPTNTPTRTNTPVPPTPTRTNTPAPPTNTPTRTNTPTGPTNTPTRTNTPGSCGNPICNQQATNDGTNVYYQFNYTGTFSWYRVYIDTDQSTGTGFQTGGIGANYLAENGTVFPYTGTGTNWSWGAGTAVTFSSSGGLAQWTIARSTIGETANPNSANLLFQVETPLYTTAIYTHTYSGGGPTATPTNTSAGPTNTPTRTSTPSGGATVNYTASSAIITNPERGFYHHTGDCDKNAFNLATLQGYRTSENISVVMCVFYLAQFKTSPINQTTLDFFQSQMNTVRSAGLKAIVRFAYTISTSGDDAAKAQVLAHLDQLQPYLQSNSDVIYLMQAGFIGAWGEWYYTQNFGNMGNVTPTDWANRRDVVNKILSVLPSSRMIQLRTPAIKQNIYQTTVALTAGEAFNGTNKARTGHHNDCFLASPDDYGTYVDPANEYPYLQAETTYLPMGGETCNPNPPRSDCPTALQELAMFHWSYLNTDYNTAVLNTWSSCMTQVKQKLGYRFVLLQGTYPGSASSGGGLAVNITVRNDGWAAPFNPRSVELVLRNTSNGTVHRFPLSSNPRFWLAGTTATINQTVTLTGVPAGSYALFLNLPDPVSGLSTRPEYSIQTANTGTWEASTGFNNLLHTVTVQ